MSILRLADRTMTIAESATLALNTRVNALIAEGETVYNLTAGELGIATPDYIQAAVRETLHLNKYTAVAGLPALRTKLATEINARLRTKRYTASNIVMTAGAKPALYAACMTLLNPGDEVIIPAPAWFSYHHLVRLAGGVVVEVPLTPAFDLDPAAIAAAVTPHTKAIIINSPQNPTGTVFSKTALEATAAALRNRNITVIADDIYSTLVYEKDYILPSSCDFDPLIIVNGFSKSQALTGWRIGYLVADEAVAQAATNLLSHVMGNPSLPSQYAALAALDRHDQPPPGLVAQLKKQRQLVDKYLRDLPGLRYVLPGGAFYFFLDLRDITPDTMAWCEQLLETAKVALVPGEAFAAPGFVRLSFVTDEAILTAALERLSAYIRDGR